MGNISKNYVYIDKKEIYDALKKLSGVDKCVIDKVFKAYADLIIRFAQDRHRPNHIVMSFPHLGRISFVDKFIRKGRKFKFGIKNEEGKNEKTIEETIKYQNIKFTFINSIPKDVKLVTRKIWYEEDDDE